MPGARAGSCDIKALMNSIADRTGRQSQMVKGMNGRQVEGLVETRVVRSE